MSTVRQSTRNESKSGYKLPLKVDMLIGHEMGDSDV